MLADPWISQRAAEVLGPWASSCSAWGATLPVGSTVPNPFELGREGKPHEHIQLGTGTVDPLVGVEARRRIGHFSLAGWLLAKTSLYQNEHRYQAGSHLLAGANLASDLWRVRCWWFMLGELVYDEQPERWDGITEAEGNLGRIDVMLDTSISWRFSGPWSVTLAAKVPVWSRAIGAQLDTPAIGALTISRSFDLLRRR